MEFGIVEGKRHRLYCMGFPTYGNGPFEKIGVDTTIPLLIAFLMPCILQCIAGQMMWNAEKGGAILSFALIRWSAFNQH
jgi:hypothetical protein